MTLPDPTQYNIGDVLYIQIEAATIEIRCVSCGGDKVWQLVEVN
jgi:hypothetical protein